MKKTNEIHALVSKKGHNRLSNLIAKGKGGPRYQNVPVLINTGTFLVYQYYLKLWFSGFSVLFILCLFCSCLLFCFVLESARAI